ncbi:hypothetical protein [Paenibacillus sp.]|uniref:Ger(x)C family spore germination protein n=1 Tax=Paenibacillus sp. TaxID=58172 RepID=UPI0028123F02|nr:hypothetical protein [Paenibacillus sp.]
MGVAEANGQYRVVLYIPGPGTRLVQGEVVTETGKTINDVVERIGMNLETNVDLLHLKFAIFDRKVAENGLKDSVSGFM